MRYKWQTVKNPSLEYPEVFMTTNHHYDQIKAEVNRITGQVRLEVKTLRGEHYESIIRKGVILREKDIKTGSFIDLAEIMPQYRRDFSSLPDSPLLALIGGNYEILTEFLGTAERIAPPRPPFSLSRLVRRILDAFKLRIQNAHEAIRDATTHASKWDLFDVILVASIGYAVFLINFDFLSTGFALCFSAIATGTFDWILRRREPWLLKIYTALLPGFSAIYLGFTLQ